MKRKTRWNNKTTVWIKWPLTCI